MQYENSYVIYPLGLGKVTVVFLAFNVRRKIKLNKSVGTTDL